MDILKKIRIKDVMVKKVVTVFEEDSLSQVIEKFTVHGVSYLCVVDYDNRVVGLISQKYLYKTKAPFKIVEGQNIYDKKIIIDGDSYFDVDALNAFPLRTVMKREPFVLDQEATLSKAIMNMAIKNVGCIPIIDEAKHLVGVLTSQDIIKVVAELLGEK